MEEQELIDLLNSIEFGKINLKELSENSIIKTKVIIEIRKLYRKIENIEDPNRIYVVFSNVMNVKTTAGIFTDAIEAKKLKDELNQYNKTWIVDIKQGVPLLRYEDNVPILT